MARDYKGFQKAVAKADKKYGGKTTLDKQGSMLSSKNSKGFNALTKMNGKRGKAHAARVKAHSRAIAKAGAKYGVHGVAGHSGGSAG